MPMGKQTWEALGFLSAGVCGLLLLYQLSSIQWQREARWKAGDDAMRARWKRLDGYGDGGTTGRRRGR
jgi:hypothetical protein